MFGTQRLYNCGDKLNDLLMMGTSQTVYTDIAAVSESTVTCMGFA
jgi:hypothetical protein